MTELGGEVELFDRMLRAVERVQDRLRRSVAALETVGVPYAVVGAQAVIVWVGKVDKSAVRNTPDVDILIRRESLEITAKAFLVAGFVHRKSNGIDMFIEKDDARDRDAVRIFFANEKTRVDDLITAPDVCDTESVDAVRVLRLAS